jgi:RHS repeat-associated protein
VLIARNVVTNTETQYTYNTYGQLSAVKVKLATGAIANVATNLSYEPMGPLKSWTTGNGLTRTRAFDLDRRLTSLGVTGAGTVQSLAYTYNANDLITKITNGVNASLTQTYGYDELSRLTGVTATAENQSFGYDANGNRTTQAVAGIGRTYSTATANNRLTGISGGLSRTYGFDANGNRTSESGDNGTHDYVYDGFNRLVQHTKNGIVTNYQINALGQRAHKRTSASEQTWFGYEANGRLRIENQFLPTESNYFEYVYLAGEPVALIRNTTELYHIHADHLGRPEAVTDAAKTVRWRANNFAFDRTVSLDTLPGDLNLGFPGQYRDRETGLWYNYFRTYDPVAGRYLESDPIGLLGGANTYTYVENTPLNLIDPSGLVPASGSMADCLEMIFGEPVNGVDVRNKRFVTNNFITTRENSIRLPPDFSTEDFFSNSHLVLHEYFHVLRQWNTGQLTRRAYAAEFLRNGSADGNRFEDAANAFADSQIDVLRKCLETAKRCAE